MPRTFPYLAEWRNEMSKYTVQVCVTYVHVVEVEAEDQASAEYMAFYEFDLDKAYRGESECSTLAIDGEEK